MTLSNMSTNCPQLNQKWLSKSGCSPWDKESAAECDLSRAPIGIKNYSICIILDRTNDIMTGMGTNQLALKTLGSICSFHCILQQKSDAKNRICWYFMVWKEHHVWTHQDEFQVAFAIWFRVRFRGNPVLQWIEYFTRRHSRKIYAEFQRLELLSIGCTSRGYEDYFGWFEIWCFYENKLTDEKKAVFYSSSKKAHTLWWIIWRIQHLQWSPHLRGMKTLLLHHFRSVNRYRWVKIKEKWLEQESILHQSTPVRLGY